MFSSFINFVFEGVHAYVQMYERETEHMCVSQRLTSRSIHLAFYCLVCCFCSSEMGSVIRTWGHQLVGYGVSGILLVLPPQYGDCSMAYTLYEWVLMMKCRYSYSHSKHFTSWVIAPVHTFITFSEIYWVFILFFILGTYLIMKLKLNFASYVKTALEYCSSNAFVIYFVCIWVCEGEFERGCVCTTALVKRSGNDL